MAPKTEETKTDEQKPVAEKKKLKTLTEEQQAEAVAALCRELKIDPQYVFASSVDETLQQITIVTNGGTRVRMRPGDDLPQLSEIQITGINPQKRRVVAGKAPDKKE